MQSTDHTSEPKKKKKKRTIDKAKAAENRKKAKAKKARMKAKQREEKAQEKEKRKRQSQGKKVQREDITIIELLDDQDDELLEAVLTESVSAAADEETVTLAKAESDIGVEAADLAKAELETGVEAAETAQSTEASQSGQGEAQKDTGKAKNTKRAKEAKKAKAKKSGKKADPQKLKKTAGICAASILVLALAAAGVTFGVRRHFGELARADAAVEAMVHTDAVELAKYSKVQHQKEGLKKHAGKGTVKAFVDAAHYMLEGVKNRPRPVEITAENALDFATIESCLINTDTGKVDVTMSAEGLAVSDDGYYYLFEENTYDTELVSEEYIIEEPKDEELTFSVNLNYNSASSRLFSKFVVAIKKDGEFIAVSRPRYITNPEAVAKYRPSFGNTKSKKGLLVDPDKLRGSELDDLGVKHAAYNIPMSKILGETTMAVYPTIYYN